MPTLTERPVEVACTASGVATRCVVVVKTDWQAVVRELKTSCLALGGPPKECDVP